MAERADIAVVGAGIVGLGTAYTLGERGASVTPPAQSMADQVDEIDKLARDAIDSLRQVIVALQSLEQRLTEIDPR